MPDIEQRFRLLTAQFEALEHNLSDSQNPEELLKGMITVLVTEELDQFILAEQSWLDSKLDSAARTARV
jgi:hypothetical protein